LQRFADKVAVITGGGAGIGLATARRIASEGGRVALLDSAGDDLEAALDTLRRDGAECIGFQGSVAVPDDCDGIVSMALQRWDRLDVLVANAGARAFGSLFEATDADWERVLSVNLRGTVSSCLVAADAMRACNSRGALVLVSSIHAAVGRNDMPIYDASKAALLSIARSLAIELAKDGIRVNSVCPGFTVTDFHVRRAASHGRTVEDLRRTQSGLFNRPAEPHEVAAAIAFLASGDASYITGTNLMVDAGRHIV
jgi:2-hydroxycyclohexanecarboxyl-CoA dehydrogenase